MRAMPVASSTHPRRVGRIRRVKSAVRVRARFMRALCRGSEGYGSACDDAVDDVGDAAGLQRRAAGDAGRGDEAVPEHGDGEVVDIVGYDEFAAVEGGAGFGRAHEVEGGAGAGAQAEVAV